jgi:hypothetical protein
MDHFDFEIGACQIKMGLIGESSAGYPQKNQTNDALPHSHVLILEPSSRVRLRRLCFGCCIQLARIVPLGQKADGFSLARMGIGQLQRLFQQYF